MKHNRYRNLGLIVVAFMFANVSLAQTYEVVKSFSGCSPAGRICSTFNAKMGQIGDACMPLKQVPPPSPNSSCSTSITFFCCEKVAQSPSNSLKGMVVPGSGNKKCPPRDGCSVLPGGLGSLVASCDIGTPIQKSQSSCPMDILGKWCCPIK